MPTVQETTVPQTRTFDITGLTEAEMEVLHSLLGQTSTDSLDLPSTTLVYDLYYAVHSRLREEGNNDPKHPVLITKRTRG